MFSFSECFNYHVCTQDLSKISILFSTNNFYIIPF
nr:hypothetical protein [Nostoc sp. NZL]